MVDIDKIKSGKTTEELLEFGIINIDKPCGPTSFQISDFVRNLLDLRKSSHFGTLDPKVTGVLPIALNRGCKLTGYFIGEDKKYVGIMRVHGNYEIKEIQEIIDSKFIGIIKQLPPVKSSVKRQERKREIKSFKVLEKEEKNFLFEVKCQGGTYIRKLVHDLGEEIKVGAHMLELRRTMAGIFSENDRNYPSINLYDLEKSFEEYKKGNDELLRKIIIPGEIVSELYPIVQIKLDNITQILTGKPIFNSDLIGVPENFENEKLICIFARERFIGIYKVKKEGPVFAKPDFVFQPLR